MDFFFLLGANPCGVYSLNDCDSLAECNDENPYNIQCRCPKGFIDVSPDKKNEPGRKCIKGNFFFYNFL